MLCRIFLFVFFACSFMACGDKEAALIEQITALEHRTAQVASDVRYTDDQLRSLMTLYVQYIHAYPNTDRSALYTYKMGEVYYRVGSWLESVRHLNMVAEKYPKAPINEQALALAGIVYEERLHDEEKAKAIYEKYLKLYPQGQYAEQANNYFRTPQEKLLYRIEQLENEMQKEGSGVKTANSLLYAYRSFVLMNPTNAQTPDFCMKGAKLAAGLGESFIALEFYNILETDFPDFGDMPYVYFLTALEYNDRAPLQWQQYLATQRPFNDFAERFRNVDRTYFLKQAEKYYKLFLQKFPNHTLAGDVKISLQNLGKSDNDIVKEFLNKQNTSKSN